MKTRIMLVLTGLLLAACQAGPTAEVAGEAPSLPAPTSTSIPNPPTAPVAPTRTPTLPAATPTPPPAVASATAPPTGTPAPTATATVTPVTAVSLVRVVDTAFFKPTFLTHAGDGRLFVSEQHGVIRIIQDGQTLSEPFLYIVDQVNSDAYERGLLSVAFHPQYAANGYFYVNYTNLRGDTVISRFQVRADNPNLADHNSEQILLTIGQPFANHNGGQLQFGPDGYLYVGMGDGGSAFDPLDAGQDLNTLLGKLLRLDVDSNPDGYAVPADNPFVGRPDARGEIWAYGLRNPWRFSFDRLTGDLFIGDVGQNTWEEIDWQPADSPGGENYGWAIAEASHCVEATTCDSSDQILPIFEYDHQSGCSITGGYVYRGRQFPTLTGNYFLGDYCQGAIWSLAPDGNGGWRSQQVYKGDHNFSSFGEDVEGELYAVDHLGRIYQIQP